IKVSTSLTHIKSEEEYMNLVKNGTWWDVFKLNVGGFFFRYSYLFFVSRIPKVLGMFLVGYVVGRSDFYKNILQHKKILYWTIGVGVVIGLPANYYLAH